MPIEDSPIPTKPANFSYPLVACRAGYGTVEIHLALGWDIRINKHMALLNIVCPQPTVEPEIGFRKLDRHRVKLQDQAAQVVQTITELWLKQSKEPLVAHIHHPGNLATWCVGDVWRRDSGDTLAQLLWHNDMAALYPMKPEVWLPGRLEMVIAGGCKLLNVKPGDIEPTNESLQFH